MYDIPSGVAISSVRFLALDAYPLGGTIFAPQGSTQPKLVAVLNSGGGIRAHRYRHFAAWLAEHGIAVLTYDYRGIGESHPPNLRQLAATVEDWTEYDVGGAIAKMIELYPNAELFGFSHSIGALLFGGAPNASQITKFVFVSPHTGFVGDYALSYRVPMRVMWHHVMPTLTRIFGYFPGKALRLGEDLPAGVALGWANRLRPDLTSDTSSARATILLQRAKNLAGDVLVVSIPGDVFATPAGVNRLLGNYPKLRVTEGPVFPPSAVARGHFSFFKPGAESTWWPAVLHWMTKQVASTRD